MHDETTAFDPSGGAAVGSGRRSGVSEFVGIWFVKNAQYTEWTFKVAYVVKTVQKNK